MIPRIIISPECAFFKNFYLEDNCFMMYQFLLYNNMNQLHVYTYSLSFEPSSCSPHPTPLGHHRHLVELPVLHSSFPLAIYFTHGSVYIWRRKWQPTPVFFPGKFHAHRNLMGYSPWGSKESDTAEHSHNMKL